MKRLFKFLIIPTVAFAQDAPPAPPPPPPENPEPPAAPEPPAPEPPAPAPEPPAAPEPVPEPPKAPEPVPVPPPAPEPVPVPPPATQTAPSAAPVKIEVGDLSDAEMKAITTWLPGHGKRERKGLGAFEEACQRCNAAEITRLAGPSGRFNIEREFGNVDERHAKCIHEIAKTYSHIENGHPGHSMVTTAQNCDAAIGAAKAAGGNLDSVAHDLNHKNAMAFALNVRGMFAPGLAASLIKNGAKDPPRFGDKVHEGPLSKHCKPVYVPEAENYMTATSNGYKEAKGACDFMITNKMVSESELDFFAKVRKGGIVSARMRQLLKLTPLVNDGEHLNPTKAAKAAEL